jgi:hypothetical protein
VAAIVGVAATDGEVELSARKSGEGHLTERGIALGIGHAGALEELLANRPALCPK